MIYLYSQLYIYTDEAIMDDKIIVLMQSHFMINFRLFWSRLQIAISTFFSFKFVIFWLSYDLKLPSFFLWHIQYNL